MLSRVERGKYNQNISLNMLLDIAEGLGVPVSVFVSFTPGEQALWNGYGLRDTVVTEGDVMKYSSAACTKRIRTLPSFMMTSKGEW